MYAQYLTLTAVALAAQASAFDVRDAMSSLFSKRQVTCPSVWTDIARQFQAEFVTNGECNDDARAAIRLAFHDCMAGGECDGSIILSNECQRVENTALVAMCNKLGPMAQDKGVGVADLIQMAGAVGIKACPGGPTMPVFVGRVDSSEVPPMGELPGPFDSADTIVQKFAKHGFNTDEFVALLGAHTASKNHNVDRTQAGKGQDTTPGQWDTKYFEQTIDGTAPFRFQSDINIATDDRTKTTFARFGQDSAGWSAAFVPAMTKMITLGNDVASLTDCTSALVGGTTRRDVKRAPINARVKQFGQ